MPSPADLGIRIGTLPTGPTNSVVDVPGVGLGHSTVVYDDAPPPFGRGVARTGVTVVDLGGDVWERPGRRRRLGAQRRGRAHRAQPGRRVGPARDAGVPDLDDAGRPRLRRRLPAAHGRAAAHRGRRRRHPDGRRVRRLLAQRPAPHARDRRARRRRAARGARLGRLGRRAGDGRGRRRHRDVVLQLEGRHRHVVARAARRSRRRRRAAHQLRAVGPAHRRRRRRRPRARRARAPHAAARGVVPRRRRHRRPARPQRVRAARHAASASASRAPGRPRTTRPASCSSPPRSGCAPPRGEAPAGTPITGRGLDPYFEAVVDATEEAVLVSLLAAHDVTGVEGRTIAALPVDRLRRILTEGRPA